MALPLAMPAQQLSAKAGPELEAQFDTMLGSEARVPRTYQAIYKNALAQRIAEVAEGSQGRIGVAAIDLTTGEKVSVLGDQRFPMASTSKIAIAATFLEGVERGRWSLNQSFPMLMPVGSRPFSSAVAPVREGNRLPAIDLIEQMITRSNNYATDALLRVVGGPKEVTAWVRRAGIKQFQIDRDIATLVRDDGEFNPANHIDQRDSATPNAMVELLAGLYQGKWLKPESRRILIGAMGRTVTGKRRMRYLLPDNARVMHKTGSLNNTSSDVGLVETPDGRTLAIAVYVTGQGTRPAREAKIAAISRALYDGYLSQGPRREWAGAGYGSK
ncbi:serine hydrolase [Qipengyuania sp.]|uniref:serine hydrolase n=1 Tax=Qipengyuania sp. TaxID=2004515 RepID=UPI0035C8238A